MAVFSGPEIINDGLQLLIDAANINSYSGSGNTVVDISSNKTYFTIYDTSGFISSEKIFRFVYQANGTASNWITTSTFGGIPSGNVSNFSYCGFYKVTDASSSRLWTFDDLGADTNFRINFYPTAISAQIEINNQPLSLPTLPSLSALNRWVYYAFTIGNSGLTYNLHRWNFNTNSLESNSAVVTVPGTIGTHITFGRRGAATSNFCGLDMGIQMMYNRTLSSSELLINFNALRSRYGL